jgi:GT2 family glycosyltransferase
MPTPEVSIVVPTYGRPDHLKRCLDSIRATVARSHEVICVSVAGDEATQAVIAESEVRHVVQPTRGGAVQAMNLGFRAAAGRYMMQINDDCEMMPYSIANAIRFLQAPGHEHIGLAAFFHNSPVRRNDYAQIMVEDLWYYVCHVRGLCFANFGLAERTLYERLGYFDERFFMYGADPDFSLKVWHEAKLAVEPCPGALVHHLELEDERGALERGAQQTDNAKLFEKWNLD